MLGTGLLDSRTCYLNCEMTNGRSSELVQSSIKRDCTGEIKTDKKVLVDVGIINRFSAYNVLGETKRFRIAAAGLGRLAEH